MSFDMIFVFVNPKVTFLYLDIVKVDSCTTHLHQCTVNLM